MGQILTPTKVKMQPTVTWPCSCNKFYSVFMIDPDAPCRENPIAGQWYHWGVLNVPGNDIDKGDVITEYFGPTPPKATGEHKPFDDSINPISDTVTGTLSYVCIGSLYLYSLRLNDVIFFEVKILLPSKRKI